MKKIIFVIFTILLAVQRSDARKPERPDKVSVKYYGCFCFSVDDGKGRVMLADPYDPTVVGLSTPTVRPGIVLLTRKQESRPVREVIDAPYEIVKSKGFYRIRGIQYNGLSAGEGSIVFEWSVNGVRFVNLGNLRQEALDEMILKRIFSPDVLFFPVSGYFTGRAEKANDLISALNPRIVIPMYCEKADVENFSEELKEEFEFIRNVEPDLEIDENFMPDKTTVIILPFGSDIIDEERSE